MGHGSGGVQGQLGYPGVGLWRDLGCTQGRGPGREGHWCQLPTASALLPCRDGRGKLRPAGGEARGEGKEKWWAACHAGSSSLISYSHLPPLRGALPGREVKAEGEARVQALKEGASDTLPVSSHAQPGSWGEGGGLEEQSSVRPWCFLAASGEKAWGRRWARPRAEDLRGLSPSWVTP